MATPEVASWFRTELSAAVDDLTAYRRRQAGSLAKRKTEVANMQDRLLNAYLVGTVEEEVFKAKSDDLKVEVAKVTQALAQLGDTAPAQGETALALADALEREGHVFRPSQPRFLRTSLAWILSNRFYIGELHRNGQVFEGRYRRLIDRATFDACQDIMNGRNRRTGTPEHSLAGGLFRCEYCGQSITGERIRRKLRGGDVHEHTYYRCANNHPGPDQQGQTIILATHHPEVALELAQRITIMKQGRVLTQLTAEQAAKIGEPGIHRLLANGSYPCGKDRDESLDPGLRGAL